MSSLSHSTFLYALGWAIANSIWQMALVWLIYHLFFNIRKKGKPSFRHFIATTFLFTGFIWFTITFISKYVEISQVQKYLVAIPSTGETSASSLFGGQSVFNWSLIMSTFEEYLPVLSAAYLVILFSLFVRLFNAFVYSHRLRNQLLVPIDEQWQLYLQRICRRLNLTKPVQISLSGLIDVPATIGYIKPVILLPLATFNHLSVPQVEAVILHEIAHIRRYDYLVNIFTSVMETVLFFNPFTQLLAASLKKEREMSCDDFVIRFQQDPQNYVAALLSIEKMRLGQTTGLAMAATGEKNQLLTRVKRILNVKSRNLHYGQKLLGLVVVAAFISSLAWISPAKAPESKNSKDQNLALVVNDILRDTANDNRVIIVKQPKKKDSVIHLSQKIVAPIRYQASQMSLRKSSLGDTIFFSGDVNWNKLPEFLPRLMEDKSILIAPHPEKWQVRPQPGSPEAFERPAEKGAGMNSTGFYTYTYEMPAVIPIDFSLEPFNNINIMSNRDIQELKLNLQQVEREQKKLMEAKNFVGSESQMKEWKRQQEIIQSELDQTRAQLIESIRNLSNKNVRVRRNRSNSEDLILADPELEREYTFELDKKLANTTPSAEAEETKESRKRINRTPLAKVYNMQARSFSHNQEALKEEQSRLEAYMMTKQEAGHSMNELLRSDSIHQTEAFQFDYPAPVTGVGVRVETEPQTFFEIRDSDEKPLIRTMVRKKKNNVTRIHIRTRSGNYNVEIKYQKEDGAEDDSR